MIRIPTTRRVCHSEGIKAVTRYTWGTQWGITDGRFYGSCDIYLFSEISKL